MRMKTTALLLAVLALGACDNKQVEMQNPELLKGKDYVTVQNGVDITLSFDANEMRVYGKVLNRYNGSYTADGQKISFGPLMSTMMAGPENMMTAESSYFLFMTSTDTYKIDGETLTIKDSAGKELVFKQVEGLED